MYLALNNLQRLMRHKTKPKPQQETLHLSKLFSLDKNTCHITKYKIYKEKTCRKYNMNV